VLTFNPFFVVDKKFKPMTPGLKGCAYFNKLFFSCELAVELRATVIY
jgi:hypothetical protein